MIVLAWAASTVLLLATGLVIGLELHEQFKKEEPRDNRNRPD